MRRYHYSIFFVVFVFLLPFVAAFSSASGSSNLMALFDDSLQTRMPDSISVIDSIPSDSIPTDSIQKKKDGLDAPVSYSAKDSIVFTSGNWGYLYGEGNVTYQSIDLKSENIKMSMDSSIVTAIYGIDTAGVEFGYPVFSDGSQSVEAKTMRYNFKTKKGYSTNSITEQGEGYINAERAKRNEDGSFFITDGKYTTCDDHEHPHFYIMLTKAKVRPKKDVVTGPAYLVIEDLPLKMIGLPFGFFPFTNKYSSGVIMPSYADELDRGFALRDGGYYFAINDYVDLAVTGEIWTKGTWGLSAKSTYKKRYKYTGSFNATYLSTKHETDDPANDYRSKDFTVNWSHSQDPKANMYRTLSASVSFRTNSYDKNQLDNQYNVTDGSTSSTVNLTQRFPNSPFSLSASMSINQSTRDSSIAVTLPNMTMTLSRIYPFKRKNVVGDEKWYEKISMSYSGDFRNSIRTKEDRFFKSSLQKDWQKAMKHSVPVSASFTVFNYLNITPSFTYNERWYTSGVKQMWNGSSHVAADTTYNFKRIFDYNFALSLQTKLYGFYEPLFNLFGIKRIRHVFTPSISISGNPDFSDPRYGFYEKYYYIDKYGDRQEHKYSPWSNGIFGGPNSGKSGNISFNFQNNIEAKVKNSNDSLVTKSIVDNLGISFYYNMMAEKYKWSDISTNLRLKLSKSMTVNLNATFDPYVYGVDKNGNPEKKDQLRINKYGTIGRLKSTGYSISPSINQDTFSKWFGKNKDKDKKDDDPLADEDENLDDTETGEDKSRQSLLTKKADNNEYDADGYIINSIKWSLSANYSMNYGYGKFDTEKMEFKGRFTHSLGINGAIQPTKNWNFSFNTTYDFDQKKFAYMSCNISRNLHCWSLSGSFIPMGPYKSYFVTLRVNSTMLQDLKYEQRNRASSYDPQWY
ncbi:putative LPS assembly protein LptD [Dysgonomonas sp. 520]|uniref:putative LPS assembly protein LptD n=1 Tax=Dysgonomonas sp. 520 TaxID=2302931 RepID=UPI0013D0ACD9|nr:putative LPS assembly protein LptD [Dysgonomonas sp. 520]NDW10820.1 LPS-assembly protein LptD [Dysgonomonas sp. 520]